MGDTGKQNLAEEVQSIMKMVREDKFLIILL